MSILGMMFPMMAISKSDTASVPLLSIQNWLKRIFDQLVMFKKLYPSGDFKLHKNSCPNTGLRPYIKFCPYLRGSLLHIIESITFLHF